MTIGAPPPEEIYNDNYDVIGHVVQVSSWKNQKIKNITLQLDISEIAPWKKFTDASLSSAPHGEKDMLMMMSSVPSL